MPSTTSSSFCRPLPSFLFSSRRRHTMFDCDWSSDVCSSDLDNAVCHNTDGGWIRITCRTADGRASLVIENGGPLLEQDQARELSQPFRRIGADRTGSDKGSGLGLSIVAAIAEAHGGSLDLQARSGGGLRVSIQLPAAAGVPAGART